ncbi:MAG: hypothetical protein ABW034_20445 [Steroidobacteraceae bacterium]
MASLFVSRYAIKPGAREEFIRRLHALYQVAKPVLDVETTILFYGWSRTGEFVAVESYRDETRLNAMRATEGFQAGFRGLMECCDKPMTLELFSGENLAAPVLAHDKALFDDLYPAGPSRFHPEVNGLKTIVL